MHPLPAGIFSAADVRSLDGRAIGHCDLPGYELMTRAGHATLNALRQRWPAARSVVICCGPGNNGGDGYVVARIARAQGLQVRCVATVDPAALRDDARRAYDDFVAAGGQAIPWQPQLLSSSTEIVVVDAMFGTGLTRPVAGVAAECIDAINASSCSVVAVDIPTGLHSDTGRALGRAVRADLTVTFIGRKLGCYLGDGPNHCGTIVFDDLDVPLATYDVCAPALRLLDESVVIEALPQRERTAHKGRHGHVLVVGGAAGMGGAARLAGEAALRAGAGLVTVATHPESLAALASRPELMSLPLDGIGAVEHALERATVVALGPGLGTSPWATELFEAVLATGKPLVVDADALNLLAQFPSRRDDWVLTPHPGEAARLLQTSTGAVQDDRLAAAMALRARYGGVVVLKGAGSLVQGAQGTGWLCDRGNPGMAVAGMGDVLTGVIAGIAAQCGTLDLAARAGVFVHAVAGDRAVQKGGERGLLACDVIDQLRACVNP